MDINIHSNFLTRYKKQMTKMMLAIDSSLDKDDVEKIVEKTIKKRIQNPIVMLDNNYTGESRDTTLLSVLDWTFDREPIICGNATFYKNQNEAINPIARMLEGFLNQRKAYKKEMFKVEDNESEEYKNLDRLQANEKINANSYYGASGAPSSAFFSEYSGAATTNTAQQVISTAEQLFEGFIADNYIFLNLTELLEWSEKVLKPFKKEEYKVDSFLERRTLEETRKRLLKKILQPEESDKDVLTLYLSNLTEEEVTVLYYKNNLLHFIDDHEFVKKVILMIFEKVENLPYADEDDKSKHWYRNIVPEKYEEKFVDKDPKSWNSFVNKRAFMDPNDAPDSIKEELGLLKEWMNKYIYCQYLSMDRIYRLKNFKRKVVTVIDTDSNILSIDTAIDFLMEHVIEHRDFGRSFMNNIFICVNMLAAILSDVVTDILLYYGKCSNIPEEFRPIFNMKNEFLMTRLIVGLTKKRYISKILLREGNLMNPPKFDIKGFDFKKASCSEYAEEVYMGIIKKYIINSEEIDLKGILRELKAFKEEIITSIRNGERKFLPNGSAKDRQAYKNPEQEQSVRGVLAWNMLYPDNQIETPAKVSLLKLNIFTEKDIEPLKKTHPEIYEMIIENIFEDKTGIFVQSETDSGIHEVRSRSNEWYREIPKKYQAKYKKLGVDAWNEFVRKFDYDDPRIEPTTTYKKRGMQVLAIPSNDTIPEWVQPYIDMSTMVNNIISPFLPVLEIFKSKTIDEGKMRNESVNRKTAAISNIVKF